MFVIERAVVFVADKVVDHRLPTARNSLFVHLRLRRAQRNKIRFARSDWIHVDRIIEGFCNDETERRRLIT